MKWLYRMENCEGIGPYRGGDPLEFNDTHKHCSGQCPSPWRDPDFKSFWDQLHSRDTYDQWQFGFKSIAQLHRWFDANEINELAKHGFYVVAIPIEMVRTYRVGKKQVIFKYR